jgi:hypothetical protein
MILAKLFLCRGLDRTIRHGSGGWLSVPENRVRLIGFLKLGHVIGVELHID